MAYTCSVFATLSEALTARQRAVGYATDREAAAALGTRESTYSRWRNGAMVPRDHEAPRLAEFLGISLDETYSLLGKSRARRPIDADPDTGFATVRVSREEFDELKAVLALLVERVNALSTLQSGRTS